MGRNKMEDEFRDKLNAREINPSPASWDRLDAMLTVTEDKKPVRKLNWLYIAAACLGFVLMAGIFYTQYDKSGETQEMTVENESSVPQPQQNEVLPVDSIATIAAPLKEAVVTSEDEKRPNATKVASITPRSPLMQQPVNSSNKNQAVAQNSTPTNGDKLNIEPKINPNPIAVNVDELLAAVEKPSVKLPKPSVKIDAGLLLSQVDGELELSFREKVIKSVSKNYKEVKVALANRNNK